MLPVGVVLAGARTPFAHAAHTCTPPQHGHAPFRACIRFSGVHFATCSQLMKFAAETSNWQFPASSICEWWSMRTALQLLEPASDFEEEVVLPSTDVLTDVRAVAQKSSLVQDALSMPETARMSAVQMLSGFKRGPLKVIGLGSS